MYRESPEFDQHIQCIHFYDPSQYINGFIAIHRNVNTNPSFGATRLIDFLSEKYAMHAALRISKAMTLKSMILNLPYGGAKGVFLANNLTPAKKQIWLRAYAEIINTLEGKFITGADAGLTQQDVLILKKYTPYVTGCHVEPAYYTAQGIVLLLNAIIKAAYTSTIKRKLDYAIKGVGQVGQFLIDDIYDHAGKIYVADQSEAVIKKLLYKYPKLIVLTPETIHQAKVDVLCPCSYGHSITRAVVEELNCKVIIGSENNQLENESLSDELHKKNILYVPDFIANCGGYLSVVSEYKNISSYIQDINTTLTRLSETVVQLVKESIQNNQPLMAICKHWYGVNKPIKE